MKFDWDEDKSRANAAKHGIRFEDACYVFADPHGLNKFDAEHSEHEERWFLLARSPMSGQILVVIHTFREAHGVEHVRLISARKATRREQAAYIERAGP